jgi:hypothetical protein
MADSHVTMTLRIADSERYRLFCWELTMLVDRMRVEASPHAEALERLVDRFTDGGDNDRPEDVP